MLVITGDQDTALDELWQEIADRIDPEIRVETFRTGERVISFFENTQEEITLIILAYRLLSGGPGPEVVKALRKKGYTGPIIAFSGGHKDLWNEIIKSGDKEFYFLQKGVKEDLKTLQRKFSIYAIPFK